MNLTYQLEMRLFNAWPALQTQVVDGYVLRFANGFTKRSNSASVLSPPTIENSLIISHVKDQFKRVNLRPVFRISPLTPVSLDHDLELAGWEKFEETCVLTVSLVERLNIHGNKQAMLVISDAPSEVWVSGAGNSNHFNEEQCETLARIVSQINLPTAFATLYVEKQPVGFGLGVVERGYVGIYDLVIDENFRGHGLGERIVSSLLHWGKSNKAHTGYLQVRKSNGVALKLYEKLGFKAAYEYHHRGWKV